MLLDGEVRLVHFVHRRGRCRKALRRERLAGDPGVHKRVGSILSSLRGWQEGGERARSEGSEAMAEQQEQLLVV